MSFFAFGLALFLYYFLHSLLADERIKRVLQKRWIAPAYYRLGYNAMASILLIPLFGWYIHLPQLPFWEIDPLVSYSGWSIQVAGAFILILALRQYDLKAFSGWGPWRASSVPKEKEQLQTGGLNGMVRHPLYFSGLLLLWGFFMHQGHLAAFLLAIISTIYIIIGTLLEEQKLRTRFGWKYQEYARRVPMLCPRCSILSKNRLDY